jgi:RNA polymerase sigma factor (sigma-70 family)
MSIDALNGIVGRLRRNAAAQLAGERSDGALLSAFVENRDANAFEELVRRHGPMVLGVCQRLLGTWQDAEDAFQAVFLVLVRKASSISPRGLVGNWLYGVARQTAVRVREQNFKRMRRERQVVMMPDPEAKADSDWNELRTVLDEELSRLPDRYRAVVILCDVEGRTRKDAARHLRCPEGSVSSKLARARAMLSKRLARRGVTLSAGAVAMTIAEHATAHMPAELVNQTIRHASILLAGSMSVGELSSARVPAKVSVIAQGVLGAMTVQKTVTTGVLATVLILGSTTFCVVAHQLHAGDDPNAKTATPRSPSTPQSSDEATPEDLVKQLNDSSFVRREAAEKSLVALGAKAIPAVRAGLKSPEAELAQRCERILPLIRRTELTNFVKVFAGDTERKAAFDHPVWKRYVALVGDSKASRELFAEVAKNPTWMKALDDAESDPSKVRDIYRNAVIEVGKHARANMAVRFLIPIWPCDQPEQVAYLLLLGSYPSSDAKFPLSWADDSDRSFAEGEARIRTGRGLGLALRGKRLKIDPKNRDRSVEVDDRVGNAAESGRVMLMLLGHWLAERNCWPVVSEHLNGLSADQLKQLLPFSRRVIADKHAPMLCRAAWISLLRRFGEIDDATLLTPLFTDKSGMDWPSTTRFGDGPGNLINQAEVREVAIGSAIFLRGRDPRDFGFSCLVTQDPPKKREDAIGSTLFTVAPAGSKEEKEKILATAVDWLAKEAAPTGLPKKLLRVAEPPDELVRELARLDKVYRHGSAEKYAEFEQEAEELCKKYPKPEERARILYHVAHVAAQGGIDKHVDLVRKYGAKMLDISRDPVERAATYSYLASAAEVDSTVKSFAERRRLAAEQLLKGYAEILAQELPEKAPERPALGPVEEGIDNGDPNAQGAAKARAFAMQEAYKQARFVEDQISFRDVLVVQFRSLYRPNPKQHGRNEEGPDELRALAMKRLKDATKVDALLTSVIAPDEARGRGK